MRKSIWASCFAVLLSATSFSQVLFDIPMVTTVPVEMGMLKFTSSVSRVAGEMIYAYHYEFTNEGAEEMLIEWEIFNRATGRGRFSLAPRLVFIGPMESRKFDLETSLPPREFKNALVKVFRKTSNDWLFASVHKATGFIPKQ